VRRVTFRRHPTRSLDSPANETRLLDLHGYCSSVAGVLAAYNWRCSMMRVRLSYGARRRLDVFLCVIALLGVSAAFGPLSEAPLFAEKGSCLKHPTRPLCTTTTTQPGSTTTSGVGDVQPSFPIRASFYYPWFPEGWHQQGYDPFTNYTPSLGFYNGSNIAVVKTQIAAMQYGGQQAGIASWWGPGTATDQRIPLLLNAAQPTTFRWSLYYEPEGQGDPTAAQIGTDLAYIDQQYGYAPGFLRVAGRPVLFVYADPSDGCAMASRWAQANSNARFFVVLKVFAGYRQCASQPAGWHQYASAVATDSQLQNSFSISPGFYKKGEALPRLARDLTRWEQNVRSMVASQAPWQLVTTFNEWGEGTSVESATQWSSYSGQGSYLDVLHDVLVGGGQPPTTTTTSSPTTTVAPTTTTATGSPGNVKHVVVVMEENRTWSNVGAGFSTMPYVGSLGGMYFPDWTETNTSENSLTQYIGLTSGLNDPDSIRSDCSVSASCNTTADNIFRQVRVAGGIARSYVEDATTGCSTGGNAAKHIPALYYWGGTDRNFCTSEVRPLTELDPNNLPTFAMITPNLCNDGHDCSNATVDTWLLVHLPAILSSAAYRAGEVLINIQYDEDHPVPNLALHAPIVAGSNPAAATHGLLLATWEDLLGLPRLTTASSLRSTYGL
jgi:Glycosyl hydrolase family 99